jgi:hypothetical protein
MTLGLPCVLVLARTRSGASSEPGSHQGFKTFSEKFAPELDMKKMSVL